MKAKCNINIVEKDNKLNTILDTVNKAINNIKKNTEIKYDGVCFTVTELSQILNKSESHVRNLLKALMKENKCEFLTKIKGTALDGKLCWTPVYGIKNETKSNIKRRHKTRQKNQITKNQS